MKMYNGNWNDDLFIGKVIRCIFYDQFTTEIMDMVYRLSLSLCIFMTAMKSNKMIHKRLYYHQSYNYLLYLFWHVKIFNYIETKPNTSVVSESLIKQNASEAHLFNRRCSQ